MYKMENNNSTLFNSSGQRRTGAFSTLKDTAFITFIYVIVPIIPQPVQKACNP